MNENLEQAKADYAPEAEGGKPQRRGNLLLLGLLSAFGPLSLDLYLPSLPLLASDLAIEDSMAQLTLSACMIGLAVGQVLTGALSDRYGRKYPLVVCLVIYVLVTVGCSVAGSIELLIGLRLFQGIAGGSCMVLARAVVRDTYSARESARAFAFLVLAAGVAPILAPVVGSQLMLFTSWRGIFAVLSLIVTALLIASIMRIDESLPDSARHTGGLVRWFGQVGIILRDPLYLVASAIQCAMGAAMFTFIAMSPFVFQGHYQMNAQTFGWMFAFISLGIVIASRISASAVEKHEPAKVIGWGVVIAAIPALFLLPAIWLNVPAALVVILLFLIIGAGGLVSPNCFALALSRQEERSGTASGLMGLMRFGLGAVTGPLLSHSGATAEMMGLAVFALTMLMLLLHLIAKRKVPSYYQLGSPTADQVQSGK